MLLSIKRGKEPRFIVFVASMTFLGGYMAVFCGNMANFVVWKQRVLKNNVNPTWNCSA